MNIDIRTLAIVVGIANLLQVMAVFLQYRVNKAYLGIGWWLLGFASMAVAYLLMLLRDFISIKLITIILGNALILLGPTFIYIGVMRLLDKKENRSIIISIFAGFILTFFYYTYFDNNITLRTVIIYAAAGTVSLLTAQSLFLNKNRLIRVSAYVNAVLFLGQGCFFAFRSVVALTIDPVNGLFTPAIMQTVSFLFLFVQGILLTFGLIIMVNQRLNAEMREAKENSELIFNTSPDAVLVTRLTDGYFVDINEGFTTLTGYTRTEVIGKTSLDINLWKNPAERQQVVTALNEKGVCENLEAVFQRKDGSQLNAMVSAKIITLQGGPHIISVTRDITERKLAEAEKEKLEAQNRQLQKSESLGLMAGAIAHHFNNQLGVVIGNLELALMELPSGAKPHANITSAMAGSNKAAQMSGMMLTYLGQSFEKREPLDLSDACLRSLAMLHAVMPRDVAMKNNLPSPGPIIMANTNQIQQVMTNLITNAGEAIGNGRGAINLSVKTVSPADIPAMNRFPSDWQQQGNAYACLEVADNGCGIAGNDIEKLFDPFFSSKFTGRGMGLAVVLGIVRAHKGVITVESEPDRGSTFLVFFPVAARDVNIGNGSNVRPTGSVR